MPDPFLAIFDPDAVGAVVGLEPRLPLGRRGERELGEVVGRHGAQTAEGSSSALSLSGGKPYA